MFHEHHGIGLQNRTALTPFHVGSCRGERLPKFTNDNHIDLYSQHCATLCLKRTQTGQDDTRVEQADPVPSSNQRKWGLSKSCPPSLGIPQPTFVKLEEHLRKTGWAHKASRTKIKGLAA